MIDIIKDAISLVRYKTSNLFYNNSDETVLVYHSIGKIDRRSDPYKISLDPLLFGKQIEFLTHFKERNLTLTFDDGFKNFFENAFSFVLRYNIRTVLFVTTDFIDGKMSFNAFFENNIDIQPLNWQQIREISDNGIEIGSHTLSHPNLTNLDRRAAEKEISDSKKKIEDMIGKKVRYFAYPFGSRQAFSDPVKQIVRDSGYERAYTNIMGFNDADTDPYELRRIRIYSYDNMLRFKMKIKGAYNWVDSVNVPGFKKCLKIKT